jgi:ferrous iron transport protein A
LGDPIEVTVRGYELSIRKSEAENICINWHDQASSLTWQ